MNLLAKYKNGNYNVKIYDDGTKIRYNDLDNLTPEFAESNDVTITTVCVYLILHTLELRWQLMLMILLTLSLMNF